jgi:peptidoglycan hydrolase CwlO-like protein
MQQQDGGNDIERGLEVLARQVDEAETVAWQTSTRADSDRLTRELNAVTQDIWELQHEIEELKDEFDL